ncbi:cation transporter [Proteus mirabilis]|uniref:Cation transporter n=1 Tax=Proteus mirabilis TaxID=584 RepID=A0A379GH58_PROMI|nr:cation transporter [Proteus mirabilis]
MVAIFIPVVLSVAARMKTSPSRLMMPLGFAGLISGLMTLVATPPNMVVNSELVREGLPSFQFFFYYPNRIAVLVAGVLYMLVVRRWLGSSEGGKQKRFIVVLFVILSVITN